MFSRKKKKEKNEPIKEVFRIPQMKKDITGLQTRKEEFRPTEFVSGMFGRSVVDKTVTPTTKSLSDVVKGYDPFRKNPLDKKAQETFEDFKASLISNNMRKELFGDDAIVLENKPKENNKQDDVETSFIQIKTKEDIYGKKSYETEKIDVNAQKSVNLRAPFELKNEHIDSKKAENVIKSHDFNFSFTNEETRVQDNAFEKPFSYDTTNDEIIDVPIFEPTAELKEEVPFVKIPGKNEHHEKTINNRVNEEKIVEARSKYEYYRLPPASIFSKQDFNKNDKPEWIKEHIDIINSTLTQFDIDGSVVHFTKGPTVTRYEISLKPGINVKKVSNIKDNLKMALAVKTIRIEAPIPGKPNIGIEVPNIKAEAVNFGNVVDCTEFLNSPNNLKVAIGLNIDGDAVYSDIAKLPHGLIAGATGSGKSVCVNTMLVSLLMKNTPDDLKLLLIDPKFVELAAYNELPHLVTPVINDAKIAAAGLKWCVTEMDKRYHQFAELRVRDISSYNEKIKEYHDMKKMPYIVVVIDELADLIMVASADVEDSIQRLTQKSRACGIHLLVATQRPTTDVIKGTIKANIPTRFTFKVSSISDSVVALDAMGAESLLGRGDMLIRDGEQMQRVQGAYISDQEIDEVTNFIRRQSKPDYLFELDSLQQSVSSNNNGDELFETIARFVVETQTASINRIQREFNIGFNRAQRIFDMLTDAGIVSESQGSKPREILVTPLALEELLKHE